MARPGRDWSKILIDAALRGLSSAELAAEQSVTMQYVLDMARAHAIRMPFKPKRKGGGSNGQNHDRRIRLVGARKKSVWTARFAKYESGAISVNDFCRAEGLCSSEMARVRAAEVGFEFARGNRAPRKR